MCVLEMEWIRTNEQAVWLSVCWVCVCFVCSYIIDIKFAASLLSAVKTWIYCLYTHRVWQRRTFSYSLASSCFVNFQKCTRIRSPTCILFGIPRQPMVLRLTFLVRFTKLHLYLKLVVMCLGKCMRRQQRLMLLFDLHTIWNNE